MPATDWEKAWDILQDGSKYEEGNFSKGVALLKEWGVDDAEYLEDLDDKNKRKLARLLKNAPCNMLLRMMGVAIV